jgi:hypothetical protein
VKYHPQPDTLAPQQLERIVGRFTGMDDDWQCTGPRQPQLPAEHFLLDVARREVVVVVQPDLSERDRPMRGQVRIEPADRRVEIGGVLSCLVRVDPDGKPHTVPGGAHRPGALPFRVIASGENHQRPRHSGGARARHDRVEIAGEFLAGQMAMGVDHWVMSRQKGERCGAVSLPGSPFSLVPSPLIPFTAASPRHLTRVPAGTS